MAAIATLDTKQSLFFDHRDPKMVKMLGEVKLNAWEHCCSSWGTDKRPKRMKMETLENERESGKK
jgi:hypothetical protein